MSTVIDASVIVKWFFAEIHSEEAVALIESTDLVLVPDLLWAELGSVFWQRVRSGKILPTEADRLVEALDAFPCELRGIPAQELLAPALAIAVQAGATLYDCLYLALAIREDLPLITADRKFYVAHEHTPLSRHVRWIGDCQP